MNLLKKKKLAARTLGVGIGRVIFLDSRKNEIKEAITKQDIRDLKNSGAILIREIGGRRKDKGRKNRGPGKIKRAVNKRKKDYVLLTRKLRGYAASLQKEGRISSEEHKSIRKGIRNSVFKSKSHLKSHVLQEKK